MILYGWSWSLVLWLLRVWDLGYFGITGVRHIEYYILSANHTANGASSIYPYLASQLMSRPSPVLFSTVTRAMGNVV